MKKYYGLASSLLTLLLVGCALPEPPTHDELRSSGQFAARNLDDPALRMFIEGNTQAPVKTWPPRRWSFNQLNLAAFYYHPDLDVARAQWQVAKAGEITAGQIPNPSGGPGIGYDKTQPYPLLIPFNFSIPIETADKRQLRVEGTQDRSKAAGYNIIATAWTVRNRLANALINDYAAMESVALYRKQEALQKPVVDIFEQRSAAGQSLSLNASQTLVAYQQTLLSEKNAEQRQVEAEVNLASALGVPVSAVKHVRIAWDDITAEDKNDALASRSYAEALRNNVQLKAALAEYVAAHAALKLELAKRIPDIDIGPAYSTSKSGDIYTIGISMTLPIFNDNEGPIAEAVARRKEAAERFNALQAKIIGSIERAWAGYKAAFSTLKTADQLLAAQQAKAKQLASQVDDSAVSKLPMLLAQSEIETAAIARLNTQVQWLKAKAALEYALEQPLFGGHVGRLTQADPRKGKP
ncbi:MAG: TolC family protein [Pseudomonadota bacterium]|nr:TolC family protein [Pseudomonadota bacterium]